MIKTPIRILGIAPYEEMRSAMGYAAQAYPDVQMDVFLGDLEEGQAVVQRMPPNTYDCIISRGGTAELIRQISDLPVIDVHVSVYDVLRTMKLAENYSQQYAVVGFPSLTEPAHTLCSLLESHLEIQTVHSASEVRPTLERLRQSGCRMVVCDMITHTVARQMGLDAFLITSGAESLHSAIEQAVQISTCFRHIRHENIYLRSITQGQNGRIVVLDADGSQYYASPADPSDELRQSLVERLQEIPVNGHTRFYYTERDLLYSITAQQVMMETTVRYLFYCKPSKIPLHIKRAQIRSMNKGECEYLFDTSFYNLSGAMGAQDAEIRSLATLHQPLIISGESGTGKEQIARFLYLHSPQNNNPLVTVNCSTMNDKSWDFLLDHYSSPLNATGNTVYFQNFEAISPDHAEELLSAVEATGLTRRVRLIFSCSVQEGRPLPDIIRSCSERLGCLGLRLPSLRSRSDEIPSLASLYLNSLNLELGRQISGFEPRALEMLRQYSWPNNYKQFKDLLRSLASLTTGPYIRSTLVADLLSKERTLRTTQSQAPAEFDNTRTLDDMIYEIVQQAVAAQGGNRSAAARQLGISRTTLWRLLNRDSQSD